MASVWDGSDAELLEERRSDSHPCAQPQRILDATVNLGRFWEGSQRPVVGLDIENQHHPDVVGDNQYIPFSDDSFDVIVYDPPHIPNQGQDRSSQSALNTRFGLVLKS